MIKVFTDDAWQDYLSWSDDKKMMRRINELIKDIDRHPTEGIGKPEPLKYDYAGMISRRINREHRLIYEVRGDQVIYYSFRDHYNKARR